VEIEPGNEDAIIPPGGKIEHTQAPFDIENAVGQLIFGQTKPKDSGGSKDTGGGAPAPAPGAQGGNAPAPQ
jgi:hypothetical protein